MQQPAFYSCGSNGWEASSSDEARGQMSGQMSSAVGVPQPFPLQDSSSFLPRNISATLLGEGDGDEPPILEELGINFRHIYDKTLSVLWPRRSKLDQAVINDSDFAGPIIFALVLALLLLFVSHSRPRMHASVRQKRRDVATSPRG